MPVFFNLFAAAEP